MVQVFAVGVGVSVCKNTLSCAAQSCSHQPALTKHQPRKHKKEHTKTAGRGRSLTYNHLAAHITKMLNTKARTARAGVTAAQAGSALSFNPAAAAETLVQNTDTS
jgi:hypothetical protein